MVAVAMTIYSIQSTTRVVWWSGVGVSAGLQLALWVVPWQRVFPGIAVLPGETAFVRRYAAEIGLVALIVTTVLGLASIVLALPASNAASAPQPAPQQQPASAPR